MGTKCNKYCVNVRHKFETLMKAAALMLCRWLGIPVLPKGWMMFDPALAKAVGVNQAILYQKMAGWVDYNARKGHNQKKGRTWTYNSFQDWGKDMTWVHPKTIQKYVGELKAAGLLMVDQLSARATDRTNWYSVVTSEDSTDWSQSLLWPEQKTPMIGAKDSDVSIGTSKAKHTKAKRKPATPRAHTTTAHQPAAVAVFSSAIQPGEFSDKPEMPELRDGKGDDADRSPLMGTDAQTTPPMPSPSSALPPPWMAKFWTECTAAELQELLRKYGEAKLLREKEYAIAQGADNPPGFARWRLANGLADGCEDTTEVETVSWETYVSDEPFEELHPLYAELEAPEPARNTDLKNPAVAWQVALSQLEVQMEHSYFDQHMRGALFEGFADGVYQVSVRNAHVQKTLQYQAYRTIRRIVSDVLGETVELQFVVKEEVAA